MSAQRYVVIGAGSIGGVVAARLSQHGPVPPLVVARGDNGATIREHGLLLRSPDDEVRVAPPTVTDPSQAHLTRQDVLVIATKTHQLQQALLDWADQPVHDEDGTVVGTAGELLPIMTLLNGIEAERLALRLFRRVIGVVVWLPAVHLTPGEVIVRMAPTSGVFIAAPMATPVDEEAAARDAQLLETVAADWEAATFRLHVVEDVMPWKHLKLLSNLGNAVQALLGARSGEESDEQARRELSAAVRSEAEAVLAASGAQLPSAEEEAAWRGDLFEIRPVPGAPAELGGSSWQSLARGSGSIETDYLNGEIVLRGRQLGIATPVNETLQSLSRRAAAERTAPGALTAADVLERAGVR